MKLHISKTLFLFYIITGYNKNSTQKEKIFQYIIEIPLKTSVLNGIISKVS